MAYPPSPKALVKRIRVRPNQGAIIAASLTLAALLLADFVIDMQIRRRLRDESRARVAGELQLASNSLTQAVSKRMYIIAGLSAFVEMELRNNSVIRAEDFRLFASSLSSNVPGVRNIALAPSGVMTMLYPARGNERVLGYQPGADPRPNIREDVERAIATRRIVLSVPSDLLQGGYGVIARQAIFVRGSYWGLANVVVDLSQLLKEAGIPGSASVLSVALRDQHGTIFNGDSSVFDLEPALTDISLPEGRWQLAAVPAGGWNADIAPAMLIVRILLGLATLLFATIVYLVAFRQGRLARLVGERTAELADANYSLQRQLTDRIRAERVQATLYEIAHAATRARTQDDFFRDAHKALESVLAFDNILICLYDRVLNILRYPYYVHGNLPAPAPHAPQHGPVERILNGGVCERIDPASFRHLLSTGGLATKEIPGGTWLGAPLTVGEETFGVFAAWSDDPRVPHNGDDLAFLEAVAQQIAFVVNRRRSEDALRSAQRLESLGTMAGGIAHDFNNILNAILGQASLALDKLPGNSPAAPNVHKAIVAAEKAADLTKQLLAYTGRGKFESRPIDLNELVRQNRELLSISLSKSVSLESILHPEPATIVGDPAQLQQVLMNLILNAGEAIGDKPGRVVVQTGHRVMSDSDIVSITGLMEPGPHAVLEVRDDGCGMNRQTMSRIFDPFFTTKFTGRGLGLAAVLGIVRGHKGGIHIESTPGTGTTFRVFFPSQNGHSGPVIEQAEGSAVVSFDKSVLVIDDEKDVLEMIGDVCDQRGISCLKAAGPHRGIELFNLHRDNIGVVLLDMSMPSMDGRQTLLALRSIDPGVRVILSSGYSEQEMTSRFTGLNISGVLHKPYRADTLIRSLATVLARPRS